MQCSKHQAYSHLVGRQRKRLGYGKAERMLTRFEMVVNLKTAKANR
jgi:hypothetical protein